METKVDYVDGFIRIKPKWNPTNQKFENGKQFELFIYQHDPNTGEPKVTGTRKIKVQPTAENLQGEKEIPVSPIAASYTIAISSLTKVLTGESRRANVYFSPKPRQ